MPLAPARTAIREVLPRLVTLIREIPDADAAATGTWTVSDVAAHLSHVFRFDIDALAGKPVPPATVTAAGMAAVNAELLAADAERDPAVLAGRLEDLACEFDDVATGDGPAGWLQGIPLPPSVVACHLLEECLIHGHDIAAATGRPWPLRRDHALLAIEGGVLPLISALPPTAFVDQRRAASFRGRFAVRLRGGAGTVLDFDRGALTLEPGTAWDVDAHVWADPAALMLVFIGRAGIGPALLGGKLAAWGLRPWKLAGMLTAIAAP